MDLVALKYSIMVNGVTKLIMMKSDVLDTFETIKACVAYKMNGEEIDYFPYDITDEVEPIYVELPGWQTDMTKCRVKMNSLKNSMLIFHSLKNSWAYRSRLCR